MADKYNRAHRLRDHASGDLGWYRAQTVFATQDPDDSLLEVDPVARALRHRVPIYHGRHSEGFVYGDPLPLVVSAEDLLRWRPEDDDAELGGPASWPSTPEEMSARLGRVIPLLQTEAKHFWDPGLSDWYVQALLWHPDDTEKVCKPAYLHAELWRNEETSEELWALVALREGWSPPDGAIERVVWLRVTAPGTADDVDLEAPGDEFEV